MLLFSLLKLHVVHPGCWLLFSIVKRLVHSKLCMKIISLMTHPHVVPRPQEVHLWNTVTALLQKGNRDIIKVAHVTSVG